MKNIFFLLSIVVLSTSLFSQKKYSDYDLSKQYLFFSKPFTNNQPEDEWSKGVEGTLEIIKEKSYWKISNTKSRAWGIGDSIKLNTSKNFQIDIGVKFIAGGDNHKQESSMLFWGRNEERGFYFYFAKDGYCSISDSKNSGKYQFIENSLTQANIKEGEFNQFSIRKVKNNYYFFVNELLMFSMPYQAFYGNLLGIGVGKKSIIEIDSLNVHYLQ